MEGRATKRKRKGRASPPVRGGRASRAVGALEPGHPMRGRAGTPVPA